MSRYTSLPLDDRQRYKDLAQLELDTIIDQDKRYSNLVKEIKYKEILGIEDLPELDLDEKERQRENYNFQIQMLFENLIQFFSTRQNLREYIDEYVKTTEKAYFINSNIEKIKNKLEGVTNLDASLFESFVSDLYREDEGLTGITTKDYQKRFAILEEKLRKLSIFQDNEDIRVKFQDIKKEYNKETLSNMNREKLLTTLRKLLEASQEDNEVIEDVDKITDRMKKSNMLEDFGEFDYVFREMEENRFKKLATEELEERFNKLMNNMKSLEIYKNDRKFELDVDFLLGKFKTIEDEKKAKYLEQLENIFKGYYAQNNEYLESLESQKMQEIDLEEENEDARNREEVLRNIEPDMDLIDDIEANSLQKILYFYCSGTSQKQVQDFVIIDKEQGDDIIDDTQTRIISGTTSSKFQRVLQEMKVNIDTFIEEFSMSYEDYLNKILYTYQLPYFILENKMYENINGLRINLGKDRMQTNTAVQDYIDLMKRVKSSFRMGKLKTVFGDIDSNYKTNLMVAWEELLFDSINEFSITDIKRTNFTEIFANEISDDFLLQTGNSIKVGKQRILIGRGILPETQPLYSQFGKFLIHNKSLKEEGKLNIKFPSLASHPKFPREKISDKLRQLILNLLETRQLSNELYNELDSQEKEMFDRLAYFSGIKEKIGSGLYSKEKEEQKEFELLKYQILSGNNSRKGLEKMKKLINKFLKENKINKSDSKGLLQHIDEILAIHSS